MWYVALLHQGICLNLQQILPVLSLVPTHVIFLPLSETFFLTSTRLHNSFKMAHEYPPEFSAVISAYTREENRDALSSILEIWTFHQSVNHERQLGDVLHRAISRGLHGRCPSDSGRRGASLAANAMGRAVHATPYRGRVWAARHCALALGACRKRRSILSHDHPASQSVVYACCG